MFKVLLKSGAAVLAALLTVLMAAQVHAQSLEIDGEVFRDPTQPPWAVMGTGDMAGEFITPGRISLASFRLSFVRAGGVTPVAVINDQQVSVGDDIDGVQVMSIRPGEVVLRIDGEEQVLSSFSRPVRTAVEN